MNEQSRPDQSTVEAIPHVPELDGMRGLAIVLVLFYHSHVPFFIDMGWCGVDLFFVLSGFLITSILLNTKKSPSYFSSFYARRMLRIFPLYFSFLVAYFWVLLPIAHLFGRAEEFTGAGQYWYWFYLQNWWSGWGTLWLAHFWSLAVEEQFYLVWPLLVFLLSRRALAYCSALTIVGCLFLRVIFLRLHTLPEVIHRVTVFRIDTLAIGGLVAVLVACGVRYSRFKYPALFSVALLAIGLHWVPVHSKQMLTVGFTAVALASAYLVFYAATNTGSADLLCRALRSPLLQRLGKYSYGMYVLHLPIVRALARSRDTFLHYEHLQPGSPAYVGVTWLTIAIGCLASYGAALLSWHLIEKHFLRLKGRFGYDTKESMSRQDWRITRGTAIRPIPTAQ